MLEWVSVSQDELEMGLSYSGRAWRSFRKVALAIAILAWPTSNEQFNCSSTDVLSRFPEHDQLRRLSARVIYGNGRRGTSLIERDKSMVLFKWILTDARYGPKDEHTQECLHLEIYIAVLKCNICRIVFSRVSACVE